MKIVAKYKIYEFNHEIFNNAIYIKIKYKLKGKILYSKIDCYLDELFKEWYPYEYEEFKYQCLDFIQRYKIAYKIIQEKGIDVIVKQYIENDVNLNLTKEKDAPTKQELIKSLVTKWTNLNIEIENKS